MSTTTPDQTTRRNEIRAAALRPLASSHRWFWILLSLLTLPVLLAVAAYIVQLRNGLGLAGYDDGSFWGIYEANLVAFIGVSYGGALVSAILRLTQAQWRAPITRLAEAMALFSLLIGAIFALIHLGRPERVWQMVVTPKIDSPLVWDFVAITTYLVITLIFLYLPLIPDIAILRDRFQSQSGPRARLYRLLALNWRNLPEQRKLLDRAMMIVAILIIPTAIIVHSVLSWAFAVTTRPGWHSTIFGPYFVVAALYSGIATVILVVAAFRSGYRLHRYIHIKHFRYLGYLMLTLGLLYLYFTFSELLTEGYVMTEESTQIVESLLIGQYAPFFWLFVVGGAILPILLIVLPWTRTVPGIVTAAALVVAGMWLKRMIIVVPAAAQPLITGTWSSFHLSWITISITVGAVAAIPLLLMLFFKFFPILDVREMEESVESEQEHVEARQEASPATVEEGVAR